MNQPVVIILTSMVAGFVILWATGVLIEKLDIWLMEQDAPIALKRRPSGVKPVGDEAIEVVVFGNVKLDAVPGFILMGYLVTIVIILLPLLTQSQDPAALGTAALYLVGFLGTLLFITLWIRSRYVYYQIDLNSGKLQRKVRTFGVSGKETTHLLKLPVEAHTDCQPKKADLQDARSRFSTCWTLKQGRKMSIVHKNSEEAAQFRAKLVQYGCPVIDPTILP